MDETGAAGSSASGAAAWSKKSEKKVKGKSVLSRLASIFSRRKSSSSSSRGPVVMLKAKSMNDLSFHSFEASQAADVRADAMVASSVSEQPLSPALAQSVECVFMLDSLEVGAGQNRPGLANNARDIRAMSQSMGTIPITASVLASTSSCPPAATPPSTLSSNSFKIKLARGLKHRQSEEEDDGLPWSPAGSLPSTPPAASVFGVSGATLKDLTPGSYMSASDSMLSSIRNSESSLISERSSEAEEDFFKDPWRVSFARKVASSDSDSDFEVLDLDSVSKTEALANPAARHRRNVRPKKQSKHKEPLMPKVEEKNVLELASSFSQSVSAGDSSMAVAGHKRVSLSSNAPEAAHVRSHSSSDVLVSGVAAPSQSGATPALSCTYPVPFNVARNTSVQVLTLPQRVDDRQSMQASVTPVHLSVDVAPAADVATEELFAHGAVPPEVALPHRLGSIQPVQTRDLAAVATSSLGTTAAEAFVKLDGTTSHSVSVDDSSPVTVPAPDADKLESNAGAPRSFVLKADTAIPKTVLHSFEASRTSATRSSSLAPASGELHRHVTESKSFNRRITVPSASDSRSGGVALVASRFVESLEPLATVSSSHSVSEQVKINARQRSSTVPEHTVEEVLLPAGRHAIDQFEESMATRRRGLLWSTASAGAVAIPSSPQSGASDGSSLPLLGTSPSVIPGCELVKSGSPNSHVQPAREPVSSDDASLTATSTLESRPVLVSQRGVQRKGPPPLAKPKVTDKNARLAWPKDAMIGFSGAKSIARDSEEVATTLIAADIRPDFDGLKDVAMSVHAYTEPVPSQPVAGMGMTLESKGVPLEFKGAPLVFKDSHLETKTTPLESKGAALLGAVPIKSSCISTKFATRPPTAIDGLVSLEVNDLAAPRLLLDRSQEVSKDMALHVAVAWKNDSMSKPSAQVAKLGLSPVTSPAKPQHELSPALSPVSSPFAHAADSKCRPDCLESKNGSAGPRSQLTAALAVAESATLTSAALTSTCTLEAHAVSSPLAVPAKPSSHRLQSIATSSHLHKDEVAVAATAPDGKRLTTWRTSSPFAAELIKSPVTPQYAVSKPVGDKPTTLAKHEPSQSLSLKSGIQEREVESAATLFPANQSQLPQVEKKTLTPAAAGVMTTSTMPHVEKKPSTPAVSAVLTSLTVPHIEKKTSAPAVLAVITTSMPCSPSGMQVSFGEAVAASPLQSSECLVESQSPKRHQAPLKDAGALRRRATVAVGHKALVPSDSARAVADDSSLKLSVLPRYGRSAENWNAGLVDAPASGDLLGAGAAKKMLANDPKAMEAKSLVARRSPVPAEVGLITMDQSEEKALSIKDRLKKFQL